jgi:hypothetical protein
MATDVKMIRLGDMLTDEQIQRCCALYPSRKRIRDEIVQPNMTEINRRLGQENDADYLSIAIVYMLEKGFAAVYVLGEAHKRSMS